MFKLCSIIHYDWPIMAKGITHPAGKGSGLELVPSPVGTAPFCCAVDVAFVPSVAATISNGSSYTEDIQNEAKS